MSLEAVSKAEDIRAGLDRLAGAWEKVTAVEISNDTTIAVDSSFLIQELKTDPPKLARLDQLLNTLLLAHKTYPQKVFTIQDLDTLKPILARPEFQWTDGPAPLEEPQWLQKLIDVIFSMLNRIAEAVGYFGNIPVVIVASLLFALVLFFISRTLSRNLVRDAELAAQAADQAEILTSKGAMQKAQTLSSAGDYRNAVRYLYLSSLLLLDEQGMLRYDRSRTNREVLRSVSSKPELAVPLHDVIDVFDRVWYGFEALDDKTYQTYVGRVDDLRERRE